MCEDDRREKAVDRLSPLEGRQKLRLTLPGSEEDRKKTGVVQARLGHASAKTTLDVYGHLFPDEDDRTRAAIDQELEAAASAPGPVEVL